MEEHREIDCEEDIENTELRLDEFGPGPKKEKWMGREPQGEHPPGKSGRRQQRDRDTL